MIPIIRLMVTDYRGSDRWFSVSIGWLRDGFLMHPSFERALSSTLGSSQDKARNSTQAGRDSCEIPQIFG